MLRYWLSSSTMHFASHSERRQIIQYALRSQLGNNLNYLQWGFEITSVIESFYIVSDIAERVYSEVLKCGLI